MQSFVEQVIRGHLRLLFRVSSLNQAFIHIAYYKEGMLLNVRR